MLGFGAISESPLSTLPDRFYFIPASETPEGQERIRAYYEALGRFVDMFARVETTVTRTLWNYAKTTPEIAKVIFAGAKIEISSRYIKQLAEANNASQELRDDLENVLWQLGNINSARNAILHYGAPSESVAEGNAMVSNALKAKGEPHVFPISPDLLKDMTDDLDKIIMHLDHRHLGSMYPRLAFSPHDLDELLQRPWRYKHPPMPKTQQAKADSPQSQKHDP